ncbi:hypothetical protein DPMN_090736 [Dreissena polymorpha]|uniref:Uncharacterized protein n=1 Tax=Dreissena polymorpha TaxID=45954 RepID=A0A9D4KYA8_DREPO|nr:hypothetical protein DPMN_090736 [Dreissena polymorpha]
MSKQCPNGYCLTQLFDDSSQGHQGLVDAASLSQSHTSGTSCCGSLTVNGNVKDVFEVCSGNMRFNACV